MPLRGADVLVPKRAKPVLVWDTGKLFSMGLLDLALNVSILVFRNMLALKWLEAIAGTNEQGMSIPTLDQLSKMSLSRKSDLFKVIERTWARQRFMLWFRAVLTKQFMPEPGADSKRGSPSML